VYAGIEEEPNGWGWSTEMNAKSYIAVKLGGGSYDGWWVWGWKVHLEGARHAAFATSGPTAETLRDVEFGPAGSSPSAASSSTWG
jgi:hypothetical protein